jgi:hypothetical protein
MGGELPLDPEKALRGLLGVDPESEVPKASDGASEHAGNQSQSPSR